MDILTQIMENASAFPDRPAIISDCSSVTWRGLYDGSRRLAECINSVCTPGSRAPLIVCGHKSPYMIMSMLACAYAGHAYCPVDISMPAERVADIIDAVSPEIVLAAEESALDLLPQNGGFFLMPPRMIAETADGAASSYELPADRSTDDVAYSTKENADPADHSHHAYNVLCPVSGSETFYIIFTSGSTGKPKGVEITADDLNNYLEWIVDAGADSSSKFGRVFINQAPFSFDLSVMDLYQCFACCGTLWTLSHDTIKDYSKLIHSLGRSSAHVWVSTPSFADICLADPAFSRDLMPYLSVFLFCGETLTVNTVRRLYERFPDAVVVNTYGPTESTVAVTDVVVTREMCENGGALPVGRAKPGTVVYVEAAGGAGSRAGACGSSAGDGAACASDRCASGDGVSGTGVTGEIIIAGNTVAKGYFNMPEKTAASFFETEINGQRMRAYRTGDLGYISDDGMLHYCGRIDNQIKLHGYRIEIEDIENNLTALAGISRAAVIPSEKDGKIKSLTAYIACENAAASSTDKSSAYDAAYIKEMMRRRLPDYMIPKKIIFVNELPLTPNGKVDRKALKNSPGYSLNRPEKANSGSSGKAVNGEIK